MSNEIVYAIAEGFKFEDDLNSLVRLNPSLCCLDDLAFAERTKF